MRKLLLFFLLILPCFCTNVCKDNLLINDQNTNTVIQSFLVPNNSKVRVNDFRPVCYNAYEQDGTLIESFNSLYTAIDYLSQNPRENAYITKARGHDSDKKLYQYSQYADRIFYYQNAVSLDSVEAQEFCFIDDLAGADNITAVFGKSPNYVLQSSQIIGPNSQDQKSRLISIIDPSIDAFLISLPLPNISALSYNIELSAMQLYPSQNLDQPVYAKIGFYAFGSFFGIVCDTLTGNWYLALDDYLDFEKCVLTSHWNQEKRCFIPDEDVVMTIKSKNDFKLDSSQQFGASMFLNFSSGRKYEFDLGLDDTKDNLMSFFAGLDIQALGNVPDYMNGAKMQNLKIVQDKGYQIEYNAQNIQEFYFDSNNSNILIYNTAVVSKDDSIHETDIYNFSYVFDGLSPAYSKRINAVQNMIDRLKPADEITALDEDAIFTAQKEFYKLTDGQKKLIDDTRLNQAKDAYCELFDGIEKVVAIAKTLELFLHVDKEYVIDQADKVFEAWDIYANRLNEDQQQNLSEVYLTRISSYYNQAFGLILQAQNVIIAIDSLNDRSTKKQILNVYEKYLALDEVQITKIIGEEKIQKLYRYLSKIDNKVIFAVKKIIEIGYAGPSDYAVYYGMDNYIKMTEMIQAYNSLSKTQANMLPKTSKNIYKTAYEYFSTQKGYMEQLKNKIELLETPDIDKVKELIELYNKMDFSSKWHFKNDHIFWFSQYYHKLEFLALEFGLTV